MHVNVFKKERISDISRKRLWKPNFCARISIFVLLSIGTPNFSALAIFFSKLNTSLVVLLVVTTAVGAGAEVVDVGAALGGFVTVNKRGRINGRRDG